MPLNIYISQYISSNIWKLEEQIDIEQVPIISNFKQNIVKRCRNYSHNEA